MAPRKGENTKKAAGNAKKAEAAAQKQIAADAEKAHAEDARWSQGAKSTKKQDAAADKAAEAARKKAEKDALRAEEEASMPSKPKGPGAKTAAKKSNGRGLDLAQLEGLGPGGERGIATPALNASGIDNALDALSLANSSSTTGDKIDRHPERRLKAAYSAFEERRLDEMKDDKALRRQQKIDLIRREFEKSPENPFNQAMVGRYDMNKADIKELKDEERRRTEARLTSPQ